MRTFQLVIDLQTANETLTEQTIMTRWRKGEDLLPGVQITGAAVVALLQPAPGIGLDFRLADEPKLPARLLNCCRQADIHTVKELAEILPNIYQFRAVGPVMIKQAIAVCVAHGAPFNPDQLDPSARAYAIQLLGERSRLN